MDKKTQSSYIPLDLAASINEHEDGVQGGEPCHVPELENTFAWMRGFVNMWTGWSNDGKGSFTDFMMVLKSKMDGNKWCIYKNEDMDSVRIGGTPKLDFKGRPMKIGDHIIKTGGKVEIKANRIYKNLAWALTGKTWNKNFAKKYFCKAMTLDEEIEALEFITKHFFVIYPRDRSYQSILKEFQFMYDKFGVDGFLIDPWNAVVTKGGKGETKDETLSNIFIDIKDFALQTDSTFNIVNHAKSQVDEKYTKGENKGAYKVVNQFMVLGGSAWDMKMDGMYSIYRPERHLDPADPKVHLYNLKQRASEVVGVKRGSYEQITFDYLKHQYYFNNVCPMTGHAKGEKATGNPFENVIDFSQAKEKDTDKVPF